jgi:hypothetical protein
MKLQVKKNLFKKLKYILITYSQKKVEQQKKRRAERQSQLVPPAEPKMPLKSVPKIKEEIIMKKEVESPAQMAQRLKKKAKTFID